MVAARLPNVTLAHGKSNELFPENLLIIYGHLLVELGAQPASLNIVLEESGLTPAQSLQTANRSRS